MKHTLTLTFIIDDLGSDTFLGYALDQVLGALEGMPLDNAGDTEGFIRADLDGALLVDKEGNAPDNVQRFSQYSCVLKELKKKATVQHCSYLVVAGLREGRGIRAHHTLDVFADSAEEAVAKAANRDKEDGDFCEEHCYFVYPHPFNGYKALHVPHKPFLKKE